MRTRRLEAALDADSAPDVDALLAAFARDVARMRELARRAARGRRPTTRSSSATPTDWPRPRRSSRAPAPGEPEARRAARPPRPAAHAGAADDWFLDREKLAWGWLALDERCGGAG